MNRFRHIAAIAVLLMPVWSIRAEILYETVALSGTSAPGTSGIDFESFRQPLINLNGDIAFKADLATGSDNAGIWRRLDDDSLELIVRSGDPVPNYDGYLSFIDAIGSPALDDSGNVAFFGILEEAGSVNSSNKEGIWLTGNAGDLWLVARENDDAHTSTDGVLPPSEERAEFAHLGNPALSADGTVTFSAELRDNGWSDVLGTWYYPRPATPPDEDTLPSLVALIGDNAPGSSGATFTNLDTPQVGQSRQSAFKAALDSGGISTFDGQGIWLGPPDTLEPVALTGEAAPDAPAGAPFYQLGSAAITPSSQMAFWGGLDNDINPEGIWLRKFGLGQLLALAGSEAPGMPDGTLFDYFFDPVINHRGNVAFLAYLAGDSIDESNHQSIWFGGNRDFLKLIAQTGSQAPGAVSGARFSAFSSPRINELGQVAFTAFLNGDADEVDSTNDSGVWALDINGNLLAVVLEGMQIEVATDDFRTVETVSISGFSDSGELALLVQFTDSSSGIIKASLPYPAMRDFDEWSDAIDNQAASGQTDDADGDGIPNIIEFAFGLDPNNPDTFEMPQVGLLDLSGAQALSLKFVRRINQVEVSYIVEVSTDLVNWHSGLEYTGEVSSELVGEGLEEVVVRDLMETGLFERCFIRVRVDYE